MKADGACIGCGGRSLEVFLDLGLQPLANAYLAEGQLRDQEPRYRLATAYCPDCHLVQLSDLVPPEEMFTEYLYFSSFSESFLRHAAEMAEALRRRFSLGGESFVLEIASNDGYLLKNFVREGVPVLGVEPAKNVAEVAEKGGVPTLRAFFNEDTASMIVRERGRADVIIGNNVLAHVPDVNDFARGVKACLKERGAAVFEVPWLMELIRKVEFDTIYHEHVFYYSLTALKGLFARAGLEVFDVDIQAVHGGSLRVYVCNPGAMPVSGSVARVVEEEKQAGLTHASTYKAFARRVEGLRVDLMALLAGLKADGKNIAGYGAAAKGTVLLNYCGIGAETVDFICDRSPHKQGRYVPGVRVPIVPPDEAGKRQPDYLFILVWNLRDEITEQMGFIRQWGGRFIVAVPRPEVF